MVSVLEHLDQLAEDNHDLTVRLLVKIHSIHKIPRLRQKLVKISLSQFESHFPHSGMRDLRYLLSGLMAVGGIEIGRDPPATFVLVVCEYLRTCESYGASIVEFLSGSAKKWDKIRPKYQDLIRVHLNGALQGSFPRLDPDRMIRVASYLLVHDLARVVPVFPFHKLSLDSPITVIRAQPDLPWGIVTEPFDALSTLYSHFPQIEWKSGVCCEDKICFVGVRFLSPVSAKTSLVLQKSLSGLPHRSTTRITGKKKLLSLAFYSETDANLFKFNLNHYSKFSRTHQQFVSIDLSDYRQGYPGLSGFFDSETIREQGLEPWSAVEKNRES